MTMTIIPQPTVQRDDTIDARLIPAHDNWMADAARFLNPVTDKEATFWERWAAVRYVEEQLPGRINSERALLQQLHAFLPPEIEKRLRMQAERLSVLVEKFNRVGRQRESARELALTARELSEALRLWYAEIEYALGGIHLADIGRDECRLLDGLNPARCGWGDANW